ncbi:MAG: hypothetical protein AB1521_12715 [Bacteroidota bacterium]
MIAKKLTKILSDKTSGSFELLLELHNHLKKEQKIIQLFPEIIDLAKNQLSSFRAIQNYLEDMKSTQLKDKTLDHFFKKYDKKFTDPFDKLFDKSKSILKKFDHIITISNSKTVYEILAKLKKINPNLKVTVCESRPKLEGRVLAKNLLRVNIHVKLITEAMIYQSVQKCNAALVGADIILKNGNIVNKVGSSLLATVCKNHKVPFYVVANKNKLSSANQFSKQAMPTKEIWRYPDKKLEIKNYYFEEVDQSLITKIILD